MTTNREHTTVRYWREWMLDRDVDTIWERYQHYQTLKLSAFVEDTILTLREELERRGWL